MHLAVKTIAKKKKRNKVLGNKLELGAALDQNKAVDFDPLYADSYFHKSSAKFKMGDFNGAIDKYTQVMKINPKDSDALFNPANIKK